MTAYDIDAMLAAADLSDRTTRLALADALEEAGRGGEAEVMRTRDDVVIDRDSGLVCEVPCVDAYQGVTEGEAPFGYVRGWFILWTCLEPGSETWVLEAEEGYDGSLGEELSEDAADACVRRAILKRKARNIGGARRAMREAR